MSQQIPNANADHDMLSDIDAMMQQAFVEVPNNFELKIMRSISGISQREKAQPDSYKNWLSKLAQIGQWGAMTIGGTLAATEVIAFVFGFWTATAAL
jgi:hypothetical protein